MTDISDVFLELARLLSIVAFLFVLIVREVRAKKYAWAAAAAVCLVFVFSSPIKVPTIKVDMPRATGAK